MKGQNILTNPKNTLSPRATSHNMCVHVCANMHEYKPENHICDNLLSCKFRSADRDELPWTNTAALELQKPLKCLASSQRVSGPIDNHFPLWCRGCNTSHIHWERVCACRCKNVVTHIHKHNCCYSMYLYVTSWLASTGLSFVYPFSLYVQDSLSLIDFIAPLNTLNVHGCNSDNSTIACLLRCQRMLSCWTNLEHAHMSAHARTYAHIHARTHAQKHIDTNSVEQVIQMTSEGYSGQHGPFDV